MGYAETDIESMFVVGDDMGMSVPQNFDVDQFCEFMGQIGFEINKDKVMFSNDCSLLKFLGYSKRGGHIHRDLEDLLKQAFFPEKFVGNEVRAFDRLSGQMLSSGISSSTFESLQILAREKYGVGYDPPDEIYLPQRRWMRNVFGMDSVPPHARAQALFHLV